MRLFLLTTPPAIVTSRHEKLPYNVCVCVSFSLEFQRVLSWLHVPERRGNWECLLFHLIRLIGLMPIKEVGVLQSSDTRLGEPINVFFGRAASRSRRVDWVFLVTVKQIKTSCKLVDATTSMHYWWGSKDKSINHSLCFINDDLFSLVIRLWKSWKRMLLDTRRRFSTYIRKQAKFY